ncbi:MAG: DUF1080 domain-containing protein, partial [Planctomycetia bacterium]|nr:DUF1080 domain-containing protein [Planctomycetia bacterium]
FCVAGCGDKRTTDKAHVHQDAVSKDKDHPQPRDGATPLPPTAKDAAAKDGAATKDGEPTKDDAISLFDGKTLGKWKSTNFGGEGAVEVKDGQLIINSGSPLSGVTWQGEPPAKMNYEISLEAQRVEGSDFFLGLTVPVNDTAISLILGGWGGSTVGLSSIDGGDAANNEYTTYETFKKKQWYKVKMVVKPKQVLVFIDGKQVIDANIEDRKIETRIEVDLSKPLGIATFSTTGAFRNLQMKKLK